MSHGLFTQPAASVLEDLDEFYFGGMLDWYHGTSLSDDATTIRVTLEDPDDEDRTKTYELRAAAIRDAYIEARKAGYDLCCSRDIDEEGLGHGCVQDLAITLQTACYGTLVFA